MCGDAALRAQSGQVQVARRGVKSKRPRNGAKPYRPRLVVNGSAAARGVVTRRYSRRRVRDDDDDDDGRFSRSAKPQRQDRPSRTSQRRRPLSNDDITAGTRTRNEIQSVISFSYLFYSRRITDDTRMYHARARVLSLSLYPFLSVSPFLRLLFSVTELCMRVMYAHRVVAHGTLYIDCLLV